MVLETALKIQKQQELATEIFDIAKTFGVDDLILAGGAPRDWYFGLPASDLDFYTSLIRPNFRDELIKHSKHFETLFKGNSDDNLELIVSDGYECNPAISEIYELDYKGQNIQIIEHADVKTVVPEFVFGLCQIKWTPSGGFEPSKIFELCADKKINIKTSKGYANFRKYSRKIRKKYPEFVLTTKAKAFDLWAE